MDMVMLVTTANHPKWHFNMIHFTAILSSKDKYKMLRTVQNIKGELSNKCSNSRLSEWQEY
jgi:hypothetical protein